jgi:pyrroloquinoline quinone (PQQ) biosynthesis protein C
MTVDIAASISDRLIENEVHRDFVAHEFFEQVHASVLTHEHVEVFLGQWWHPLHYFPTFLARCISVLPDIESKSAIARILSQEAGVRSVKAAHEVIYANSMGKAGYDEQAVTGTAPFEETAALVAWYEECSGDRCAALGGIFATEVTDLIMVSAIGEAVKKESGTERNAWVDIHVTQEPDHVDQATNALFSGLTVEEEQAVLDSAEEMWRRWTAFFDRLVVETGMVVPPGRS